MRRVFLIFIFSILAANAFANTEVIQTSSEKQKKKSHSKTLLESFNDNYGRLYYFAQEITNNIDDTQSTYSFDFVNPQVNTGLQEFSYSIIPGLMLLEDVEKTAKERQAIKDINAFLETNYKTNYLPAKVYRESKNIERPLYISQLREIIFDSVAIGDLHALRAMLDNYNLINITNDDGYGLLSYAILHNQDTVAELLIKKGIDVNTCNKYGASPITLAARSGNFKIAKLLVEHKNCDIYHRDKFGNTAIDYAYLTNNRQMQAYLGSLQKNRKY